MRRIYAFVAGWPRQPSRLPYCPSQLTDFLDEEQQRVSGGFVGVSPRVGHSPVVVLQYTEWRRRRVRAARASKICRGLRAIRAASETRQDWVRGGGPRIYGQAQLARDTKLHGRARADVPLRCV